MKREMDVIGTIFGSDEYGNIKKVRVKVKVPRAPEMEGIADLEQFIREYNLPPILPEVGLFQVKDGRKVVDDIEIASGDVDTCRIQELMEH